MSDKQILNWIRQENSELISAMTKMDAELYRVKSENERLKQQIAELNNIGDQGQQPTRIPLSYYETVLGGRPNYTDTAVNTAVTGHTQRQMDKANKDFNVPSIRGNTDTRDARGVWNTHGMLGYQSVYGDNRFVDSNPVIGNVADNYRSRRVTDDPFDSTL